MLANEILRLRCQIDPYLDHPSPEHYQVTRRRIAIQDHMLEKSQIATLVESGAGERELTHVLQLDLSLLAETFAHPEEEYICFSQFPIGDKIADFVVFTSRSRMLVTLIEIKGADFYLSKSNHYGSFHSKIEEAALQIRNHERYISNHYDQSRLLFHQIHRRVEQGETLYRCLLYTSKKQHWRSAVQTLVGVLKILFSICIQNQHVESHYIQRPGISVSYGVVHHIQQPDRGARNIPERLSCLCNGRRGNINATVSTPHPGQQLSACPLATCKLNELFAPQPVSFHPVRESFLQNDVLRRVAPPLNPGAVHFFVALFIRQIIWRVRHISTSSL